MITCSIAYGVRGILTLVLRDIGTLQNATDQSQIVQDVFVKTLFFNFVFSVLDLPNVLYVYVLHYRNFKNRKEESLLIEDSRDAMSFCLTSEVSGSSNSKLLDDTKHNTSNNRISKPISLFGLFEDPLWSQDVKA